MNEEVKNIRAKMPLDYVGITGKFTTKHRGIDLGWHNKHNCPVYASLGGKIVQNGFWEDSGNTLVIASCYPTFTIITRYLHLKKLSKYKVGSFANQYDKIGNMGNTGYKIVNGKKQGYGEHLHFEFWICPKDYVYSFKDQKKYVVNPLDYVYLYPTQATHPDDTKLVQLYIPVEKPVQEPANTKIWHTVVRGDTLWKISKKYKEYNVSWTKIWKDNIKVIGLNPNKIKIGKKLIINK